MGKISEQKADGRRQKKPNFALSAPLPDCTQSLRPDLSARRRPRKLRPRRRLRLQWTLRKVVLNYRSPQTADAPPNVVLRSSSLRKRLAEGTCRESDPSLLGCERRMKRETTRERDSATKERALLRENKATEKKGSGQKARTFSALFRSFSIGFFARQGASSASFAPPCALSS